MQGELDDAKARWLPELKEKVEAISEKFTANFARIGSVGEVGLHEAGERYNEYAIQIRVRNPPGRPPLEASSALCPHAYMSAAA